MFEFRANNKNEKRIWHQWEINVERVLIGETTFRNRHIKTSLLRYGGEGDFREAVIGFAETDWGKKEEKIEKMERIYDRTDAKENVRSYQGGILGINLSWHMVNKAIKKMVNDSLQNKKYENMKTEKMNQRDI